MERAGWNYCGYATLTLSWAIRYFNKLKLNRKSTRQKQNIVKYTQKANIQRWKVFTYIFVTDIGYVHILKGYYIVRML